MRSLRRSALQVAAVLLSGTLWSLTGGINHFWAAAWVAPVPLLAIIPDLTAGRAVAAALIPYAIGSLNIVFAYPRLPPALLVAATLLIALPPAMVAMAWRSIARGVSPAVAVLAFPSLATAMEYLVSELSPHGTFGSVSYSQGDVPVVLQIASATGLWGVSFLVSLAPAAAAVAWRRRREPRSAMTGLAIAAAFLGLALGFGQLRLSSSEPPGELPVGLAVSDIDAGSHFEAEHADEAMPVIRAYADRAVRLARAGAEVVVLPEKFVGVTPAYVDVARSALGDAARAGRAAIVAGLNLVGAQERRNVAMVFDAEGRVILEYDKRHFVPGLEDGYRRGAAAGILTGAVPPAGVAICKDLDFVPLGREYARASVGVLLIPAWDFGRDGWIHSRMAVMRGVEGGYAIVRSATNGLLTVSSARGVILAERSSAEEAEVLLTAKVPMGFGGTFYSRTGDWFAWLCVAGVVACSTAAWKKRRMSNV